MRELLDGFAQFALEVVGEVQRSVIPNNYFNVFDVTHVKHNYKDIFFEGKCSSSCISKYYIEQYCL